jgi:steroid delta-isomerase-like uncharacterized protein
MCDASLPVAEGRDIMRNIKQHLDDLAADRWDDYKAAFADNVIYEEVPTRTRIQGADEYIKTVQKWKRAFPDLRGTLLSSVESGDKVISELEWEGTHSGPREGPFGTIPATNKKSRVKAVIVETMKGDKVIESHHYFDLLSVLGSAGAMPAFGAMAQSTADATQLPKH